MNAKAARHFLQLKAMAWLEAGGEKNVDTCVSCYFLVT
jgi:hypothetical protein